MSANGNQQDSKTKGPTGAMSDMEQSLWGLANGVTAFSVLQAIAFLYALASPELVQQLGWCEVIFVGILVFLVAGGSILSICRIGRLVEAESEDSFSQRAWRQTNTGRRCAIVFFNALSLIFLAVLMSERPEDDWVSRMLRALLSS